MQKMFTDYLSALEFGDPQVFNNMSLVPLFTTLNGAPQYVLLGDALQEQLITITEVDQSGSVPELKVINSSPLSILLLDGEELVGAKQNRVLNTSILLGGHSETTIPVSCTEHGRWAYTSRHFSDSDLIMAHGARASKTDSVSRSLHAKRGYSSDQHRVWSEIAALHQRTATLSTTGAMRDAYTAKTEELDQYLQVFEGRPDQKGSIFFINGEPVGLEVISQEASYKTVHPKLIKSYAMEALSYNKEASNQPSIGQAKAFLEEMQKSQESHFPSTGQGLDYRFEGANLVGSSLVLEDKIIHLTFFRLQRY